MTTLTPIGDSKYKYLSIVAGNLAQKVSKDTEGAKLRKWEKDGKKYSKWELLYSNVTGKIQGLKFKDTEFGEVCEINLGDVILTLNTSHRYFQDFACKVMSADLKKEITLHPYDFETDEGKRMMGISVQQDGEKLENFFYDGEKKVHGFPEVGEEKKNKLKKNYWKGYIAEVTAFLTEQLENLNISIHPEEPPKEEDVNIDDISTPPPFSTESKQDVRDRLEKEIGKPEVKLPFP